MDEFEAKNYDGARGCADAIKTDAENIMSTFNEIDAIMKQLYGANWESSGADDAKARYDQIRRNYEVFYNNVINMNTYVHKTTDRYEQADAAASSSVSNA